MHRLRPSLTSLLLPIIAALLLGAGEAQAKRGFRLYTFGPANSEMGPIKKEALAAIPAGERHKYDAIGADTVGFNYQHFGLFFLDIWSWSGKYTVYNKLNEVPYEVSSSTAAALLGVKESELSKPLSYYVPWGLVIILGLVALKFVPRLLAMKAQKAQKVPDFTPPPPVGQPRWTPMSPPPAAPSSGGPPPIPPPLPPEQP